MSFCDMMEILKEKNGGRIVLCNNGSFYVAIGNDAIALNKELKLQLSCMKKGVCKVGFPINALEKYTGLLIETGYSFIIYDFNSEKEELGTIMSCLGKRLNWEIANNKYFKNEKISVVRFKVELIDGNIINVIGYNYIVDFCYQKLEKGNIVNILGKLNTKMEIEIKEFERFCEFEKNLVKVT